MLLTPLKCLQTACGLHGPAFLLLAALALLAPAGAVAAERTVRFGTEPNAAPFEWRDATGTMKGLEVELVEAYCAHLQVHCVWVTMDFDGLIPALRARQIDAVIGQLGISEARRRSVQFTRPVTTGTVGVIGPAGSTVTDETASFRGHTVAVQSGTVEEAYANAHLESVAELRLYPTQEEIWEDLLSGRADAALVDTPAGWDWLTRQGKAAGFAFLGKPLHDPATLGTGDTAIAVRLDDADLRRALDRAIADLAADGTFARITAAWFPFSLQPD